MLKSLNRGLRVAGVLAGAGIFAAAQGAVARPGAINYVEGQVNLDGQNLSGKSIGSADVDSNQVLRTADGRAEMLLTPGVFLRVGKNSAVRMVSPDLTDTRVQLLHGEALVEVTQLYKQNRIDVLDAGADTTLLKRGLYAFNADQPKVAVLDGEAQVAGDDGQNVTVKKGKEVSLTSASLKPEKFDRKGAENSDPLYAWSSLRSQYLSAANIATAQTVVVNGPGWFGSGWYWNPWWDTWAFVPGSGFAFSPFGWGFYSPGYVYSYAPLYYSPYRYSAPYAWHHGGIGVGRGSSGAVAARPVAPVAPAPANNGVHFGSMGRMGSMGRRR